MASKKIPDMPAADPLNGTEEFHLVQGPNSRHALLSTLATWILGQVPAVAGVLRVANNLGDLASAVTARVNLGLGSAATFASSAFLQVASNLSDVANVATARTNLSVYSKAEMDSVTAATLDMLNRPVGKAYTAKVEYLGIAGGVEATVMDVAGQGFVSSMFIAIDDTDFQAREMTLLKIYVDGEATPSVSCTLARFFAADYNPPAFQNRLLGFDTATAGGGGNKRAYRCFIPMPFSTRFKVTLTPPAGFAITNSWVQIGYNLNSSVAWGRMKRFRCVETTNATLAAYARQTILNIAGRGVLLGTYLRVDGTSMSFLEGNVRIFVDAEGVAAWESSALEDYFLHGFYFESGVMGSAYAGLTKLDLAGAAIGAYRFHLPDPIQFETGLKIDFQNGDNTQQAYAGPSDIAACVWYYTDA